MIEVVSVEPLAHRVYYRRPGGLFCLIKDGDQFSFYRCGHDGSFVGSQAAHPFKDLPAEYERQVKIATTPHAGWRQTGESQWDSSTSSRTART